MSLMADRSSVRRISRLGGGGLFVALVYVVLAATVVYPLAVVFLRAVTSDHGGLAVSKVIEVFGSQVVIEALKTTLLTSAASVSIAAVLGVTLAWLVGRTDMPGKRFLDPLNMLPFFVSGVVGALSWQAVAAPRSGLLNGLLAPVFGGPVLNIYSITGMVIVLGLYYTPYIYLFTLGSLQNMDPALEDSARVSGASIAQTALRITLPLSAPAILSGCILVFVTSAGVFGVPLLLGSPGGEHTLSTLIYASVTTYPADYATASILSAALFLFTAALTVLQLRLLRGRGFATVIGRGFQPRPIALGRFRWVAFGVNCAYLALVIGPFLVLLLISFQDVWVGAFSFSRLTIRHYVEVVAFDEVARRGLVNSLFIAVTGASIAVLACFSLALIVHRTQLPGRFGLVGLSIIPVTIPGVVLGVGYLIVALQTPLYGTIAIIIIAYVVHFLPTGLRNIEAIVISVSAELDECARVCGASWATAMAKILFPLCLPAMVSTWILLFVIFVREVSASIMLYVHGTETMSVALIQIMESRPLGVAAAFSVIQTVLLLICAFAIRLVPVRLRA